MNRAVAELVTKAATIVTAAGMRHLFINRRDGSVLEKSRVLHVHWVTKYPKKLGLDPASVEGLELGNETFDAVPPEIQAQVLKSWIRITNWSRTFMCEMGERFTKKDLGLLQDFVIKQPGVIVGDAALGKVEIFVDGNEKARVKMRDFVSAGSPRDVGASVTAASFLLWVYAWNKNETQKGFDTTTKLPEAKQMAKDLILDEGYHHAYIIEGTDDGPDYDRTLFYAEKRGRGVRIQPVS